MPPYQLWLQGRDDIGRWHVGPGHTCNGSVLVPIAVNGSPAFAHYRPGPNGHEPFGIQVLELTRGPDFQDHLLPGHRPVRAVRTTRLDP